MTSPETLDPTPPTPPVSSSSKVFTGPFGLRAGWSLLLYLILAAVIVFGVHGISVAVKHVREHKAAAAAQAAGKPIPAPIKSDPNKPELLKGMIIGESILFAAFLLLSWLMAAIEHRKLSVFGLGGIHPIRRLLMGALWGFLAMSLLIATLRAFHLLAFDTLLDHGPYILFWGAVQLFSFLLVGLTEEYVFRGYLQFTLTRGMVGLANSISTRHARTIAFWIAATLTSALFLYAHIGNGGETKLGLFQVFLAGMVLVIALWRTGSLWWAIGFHMTWDWCQSFLYGVPDSGGLIQGRLFATHASGNPLYSGGTTGPEGSLLCIPILLLVITVLFFTHSSPQPSLELPSSTLPPHPDSSVLPPLSDISPSLA
jgi:uncharacterized protein